MKGIYLTEEGKKEIEAKIAELEFKTEMIPDVDNPKITKSRNPMNWHNLYYGELTIYKEILSSATILPVEESYNDIQHFETSEHGTVIRKHFLMANYSNGVIIQPKQ
jgi:hypothetical protein